MPTQLYNKEQILDACLAVFARHGYEKTSTVMLAAAAGISRSLLFYHFKSRKELYLGLVDRCFAQIGTAIVANDLLECRDFFEAREKLSLRKFAFKKTNPDADKLLKEAFFATPVEMQAEIKERYGAFMTERNNVWKLLFERVSLREGIDREEAFELIMLTLDYFDQKYFAQFMSEKADDEVFVRNFLDERKRFLTMIRYGIENPDKPDKEE